MFYIVFFLIFIYASISCVGQLFKMCSFWIWKARCRGPGGPYDSGRTLRSRLFARLDVARAMSCAMSPAMFSHNKAVIIRVRAAACCAAIDAGGAG